MRLFSDDVRTETRLKSWREPEFPFLDRSARADCTRLRVLLEDWFSRYPEEGKGEFRAAFRSRHDWQHSAAAFELILHELLLRLGCRLTLHPEIAQTRRRPDFLVEGCGGAFYLEATTVPSGTPQERGASARLNVAWEAINSLPSPDIGLYVRSVGTPRTPPPIRELVGMLRTKLQSVDLRELETLIATRGRKALPQWSHAHDGWHLRIVPVPRLAHLRGTTGLPTILRGSFGMTVNRPQEILYNALTRKGREYGTLDLPFIVAVNVFATLDEGGVEGVLFGARHPRGIAHVEGGAWRDPELRRVSAALVAVRLSVWNVTGARVRLYHNPWASKPCVGPLDRLPRGVRVGQRIDRVDGLTLGGLFALPRGWPEFEANGFEDDLT